MNEKITYRIRSAASKFHKTRAEYYKYLAQMLESSKGDTKFSTLFERDAQRYAKEARGILCSHWADLYMSNGGNLGATWEGTLPDGEVTIIRTAQDSGDGALTSALKDLARIAALSDKVKSEVKGTLAAAVIGMSIAIFMATIFPIFSSQKLIDIYSFIPLDQWGVKGKSFNAHAQRVKDYGPYVIFAIILIVVYIKWTVDNLIGPIREWLDKNIAVYKVIRDIKGALFLSTMSTLTRKRGNVMFTLRDSLSLYGQSARSPWLRWRVEQIVDGIDQTGAVGTEAFNTPLLSREMYYFLRDTQEACGFAEGFIETGNYVENNIMDGIIKRMTIYRWVMLLAGVFCVIFIMGWQFSIIYEMKGVMSNYYSSK